MSRFDMGRANEALDFDYSIYPKSQRRQKLLEHLEPCIEDEPAPTLRRDVRALLDPSLRTVFLAVVIWDLTGPIWRLGIQISHGQQIDLLPFLTLLLGGFAAWRYFRTPHHRTDT